MINRIFKTNWEFKERDYFRSRAFFVVTLLSIALIFSYIRGDQANRKEPTQVTLTPHSIEFLLIQEESQKSFQDLMDEQISGNSLIGILFNDGLGAMWTRVQNFANADFFSSSIAIKDIQSIHLRPFNQGDYPISIATEKHEKVQVFGREATSTSRKTIQYYLGSMDPLVSEYIVYRIESAL